MDHNKDLYIMKKVNKKTEDQSKEQIDAYYQARPWLFKPGQSGNPGGRPKGSKSLKTFAREYLQSLSNEEKLEYMKGLEKETIWKMGEGNPKQDTELKANLTISDYLDGLENGQETPGQNMETEQPLQD